MVRRTSGAIRFNIYKFSDELGLTSVEKVISKGDYFIASALFYLESVQRYEYRADTFSFWVPVTARAREFCSNWR